MNPDDKESKLIELFLSIGIQVKDEELNFRGIGEVTEELSKALDLLSEEDREKFMEEFINLLGTSFI